MILKIIFPVLLVLIVYHNSTSQNKSLLKHKIEIKAGISDFHVRDELASPLAYRNLSLFGSASYSIISKKILHNFEVAGYHGYLKSNLKNYEAENFRASFSYNYFYMISMFKFLNNNLKLYLGVGLFSFLNYSRYKEYISDVGLINTVWYWSHSAEICTLTNYSIDRSNFQLGICFSLISNVSRPTFSSHIPGEYTTESIKPFGKIAMPWVIPTLQAEIKYEFTLNNFLGTLLQYKFLYSKYSEPRKISLYSNDFRGGIFFLL